MNILKRASISLAKKEEPSAVAAISDAKDDESKRPSLSLKGRLSLSFKGKSKADNSSTPTTESSTVSSKATPDNPHPYEDIANLPDRRRAPSRKSVTWKDPQTNDLAEVLRTRAKSIKDKDGRRTSLSWTQAPMKGASGS